MESKEKRVIPQIKICGIRQEREVVWLADYAVDYAGFVIFEKSKRYISVKDAGKLIQKLPSHMKPVAVTVSPSLELVKEIEDAGFSILQVHGTLSKEVKNNCRLPIWRAVNISRLEDAYEQLKEDAYESCITGFVIDGANYGSGVTFDWEISTENTLLQEKVLPLLRQKTFILAGGLKSENVSWGVKLFAPDIVDVSSGVEGMDGKEEIKIKEFVREVRKNG